MVPLHDNRPGLRSLLQVEVRTPEVLQEETERTEGRPAMLDFIASTAMLDRYHEVIEPERGRA